MVNRFNIALLLLFGVSCIYSKEKSDIYRGRSEGTFYISASNVAGNGNIFLYGGSSIAITDTRLTSFSPIGGLVGLTGLMQISGEVSFVDFNSIGPIEAHLQITTPKNGRLRFFGIAIMGDLYLSSSLDTLSSSADTTKPEFNSYLLGSAVIDFDWIARKRRAPIKNYLSLSFCDDSKLLFEYKQISFKGGAFDIEISVFAGPHAESLMVFGRQADIFNTHIFCHGRPLFCIKFF